MLGEKNSAQDDSTINQCGNAGISVFLRGFGAMNFCTIWQLLIIAHAAQLLSESRKILIIP